jgi:hypothetical protein
MIRKNLVIEIAVGENFVNVVVISMELVIVTFVLHPQKDQDSAGDTYYQANQIG